MPERLVDMFPHLDANAPIVREPHLYKHPEIEEPYPFRFVTQQEYPKAYSERIQARKPLVPPKHLPGTLVYSPLHDANVPLLRVEWRSQADLPKWHGWTPGYGDELDNFQAARWGQADGPLRPGEAQLLGAAGDAGTVVGEAGGGSCEGLSASASRRGPRPSAGRARS